MFSWTLLEEGAVHKAFSLAKGREKKSFICLASYAICHTFGCKMKGEKNLQESASSSQETGLKMDDNSRQLNQAIERYVHSFPDLTETCVNETDEIALSTVNFSHLHNNLLERGCEAISGNFPVSVRNCLTSMFKQYIVMQIRSPKESMLLENRKKILPKSFFTRNKSTENQ